MSKFSIDSTLQFNLHKYFCFRIDKSGKLVSGKFEIINRRLITSR